MSEKHRMMLKSIAVGAASGLAAALIVFAAVSVYAGSLGLDEYMMSVAKMIRSMLSAMCGITVFLGVTAAVLGRNEKKQQRRWTQENRRMAQDYNADIKGVNLAGLIDDSQGKEFCTIYGERINKGEDHGTMFMIFKTLMILSFFMTVSTGMVLFFMLAAMK